MNHDDDTFRSPDPIADPGSLGALLTELAPAPDHRPGFWADVRAELRAEDVPTHATPSLAEADATTPEASGGVAELTPLRPSGDEVVAFDPGRRRRRWLPAAAAAAVLAVAVAAGTLTDDAGDRVGVATDPDRTTAPDTGQDPDAGAPIGPLRPAGDPADRGQGRVLAVDHTGRFVYLADDAAEGGTGCEGVARQSLWVEPIGGGERVQAIGIDLVEATGGIEVVPGPDGRVAISTNCEGSDGRLVVAEVAADGTLVDPVDVQLDGPSGPVDLLFDLAWLPSGELVGAVSLARSGIETFTMYRFDVDAGTVVEDGVPDAFRVAAAGGRVVTATPMGEIRLDGVRLADVQNLFSIHVSSDGRWVVAGTAEGVVVVDVQTGDQRTLLSGPTLDLHAATGGGFVALEADEGRPGQVRVVWFDPASERGEISVLFEETAGVVGVALAPDGATMFVSIADAGGGPSDVRIVEQPLAR